jgi:hypothetical protein
VLKWRETFRGVLAMSIRIGLFSILTILATAVGCSHGGSEDDAAPADTTGDQALSGNTPLSQDLLCAAVKAADDSNQGEGLKKIPQGSLKGDAAKDFKSFQKNMLPDFPSQGFELPVKLGAKTFTFVMVQENNDGGQEIGIYREDGSTVATVANSESEQGTWSKPADKCPE